MGENVIVGISGASGSIYGRRLLDLLDRAGCRIDVIITDPAREILAAELNIAEPTGSALLGRRSGNITFHDNDDLSSPLASGSVPAGPMVVCPCSSHTVAAIAAGLANTLLLRAAYVTLKQRRRLVLVHRETPLTAIDLENMLKITRAGGIVCPAAPAFYMNPSSIDDLIDSIVARVLDLIGIEHQLPVRFPRPQSLTP